MSTCKNCQYSYSEGDVFCSQCGQKTNTHRINFHFLVHEVQHGIFHVDSGILYTLKELFICPGKSISAYIEGKRKKHFKPVLLIMILGALYAFIGRSVNITPIELTSINSEENDKVLREISSYLYAVKNWIQSRYALYMLLQIPFIAWGFHIVFKKYARYNYAEWLVVLTFITGQGLAISIISLLIQQLIGGYLSAFFVILKIGYMIWAIVQIFPEKPLFRVVVRIMFAYLFSLVLLGIVGVAIASLVAMPYFI